MLELLFLLTLFTAAPAPDEIHGYAYVNAAYGKGLNMISGAETSLLKGQYVIGNDYYDSKFIISQTTYDDMVADIPILHLSNSPNPTFVYHLKVRIENPTNWWNKATTLTLSGDESQKIDEFISNLSDTPNAYLVSMGITPDKSVYRGYTIYAQEVKTVAAKYKKKSHWDIAHKVNITAYWHYTHDTSTNQKDK